MIRFFVATGPDGQQFGWQTSTREQAETRAAQRFGPTVRVVEVSVVQWRKWKDGQR